MLEYFYDTCAFLDLDFDSYNLSEMPIVLCSKTIEELEQIKTSANKDEAVKYKARNATRFFAEHFNDISVVLCTLIESDRVSELRLEPTNDNLIISSAVSYISQSNMSESMCFVSNDRLCLLIAKHIFGISNVAALDDVFTPQDNEYVGYKTIALSEDEMANFYEQINVNTLSLLTNQYALLQNESKETVDVVRWDGNKYKRIGSNGFSSKALGTIKPLDDIQRMAFDSLMNMNFVALCGRSGSGKTVLSLTCLMQMLEKHKIRRINIIGHFEPLKGSRQLGFMKGSRTEKQLSTGSLGNILSSKFGDSQATDEMMSSGVLNIVSASDLRGVEFQSDEAVFVTEAQDMDSYTVGTIIQRCKDGAKIIFEGDLRQIDIMRTSGFQKAIDIFKGDPSFACVKLKNDYRSPLSIIADKMFN